MGTTSRATKLATMPGVMLAIMPAIVLSSVSPLSAQTTPSRAQIIEIAQDLRSEDAATRQKASQQLRRLGPRAEPAIPILILLLADPRAGNASAQRLIDIGKPAARPVAQALAKGDPQSQTFRLAFSTIRRLGPRAAEATDILEALAGNENRARRSSAIRLLGGIGDAAFPALERGFRTNTAGRRIAFAQAIGNCAVTSDLALTQLCRFAAADDLALRQTAASYLRPLPVHRHAKRDVNLRDTWLDELSATAAQRRQRALDGLEALGQAVLTSSSSALIAILDDDQENLRRKAAMLLAQTGPTLLPLLETAAETGSLRLGEWITICAGHIGEPAIPFLALRLQSPSEAIRWRAANALQRIGADSLPSLLAALASNKHPVMISVLEALRLLGSEASSAINAIKALLEHKHPAIRSAATSALNSIEESRSR